MCINRCRVSKTFVRNTFLTVVGLLLATLSGTSYAFVRLSTGANALFWPSATTSPISFVINNGTVNGISQASYEGAVRRAFQNWQDVPDSSISFTEDSNPGSKNRTDYASDDIHTVIFDASNSTGFFGNSGLVAVTPVEFTGDGAITDADIILNAKNHTFSTTAQAGAFDVQSIVTHEVGHFIGLDHSPVLGATMVPFALQDNFLQRSLDGDDKAAVTSVYPDVNAMNGQLRGRIVNGNNNISGAHVVAVHEDGSVASTTVTNSNGDFTLSGLSSQKTYAVFAEPLDGPIVASNLSTGISGLSVETDFGTTFYGSFDNPSRFVPGNGFAVDLGTLSTKDHAQPQKMNISASSRNSIVLGSTINVTLATSGLRLNDTVSISNPDITVSNIVISGSFGTLVTMRVHAPLTASPGLYSIYVSRSNTGEGIVLTGSFEVISPSPTTEGVSPNDVDGSTGAIISVFGRNFKSGLKVIIGNTIIDNPGVVTGEEVQFTLQGVSIASGTHDVRVENPDGQFALLANALTVSGTSAPAPTPAPAPAGGGGGGGGGGGCSVSAAPIGFAGGLGNLLPLLVISLLLFRRRF
jgi:hypothetical protein